jgi:hypothetical protein
VCKVRWPNPGRVSRVLGKPSGGEWMGWHADASLVHAAHRVDQLGQKKSTSMNTNIIYFVMFLCFGWFWAVLGFPIKLDKTNLSMVLEK